jgi:hypothetical protein
MSTGDAFRDHVAALLRTRYDNVRTELQLTAKKADICFDTHLGARRITIAVECKKWGRSLTRDDVRDILGDYAPAKENREINEMWIVCEVTPAPGARKHVEAFDYAQILTSVELEQSIIDFTPMLNVLVKAFEDDGLSRYFVPPSYHVGEAERAPLHNHIKTWLQNDEALPIAIVGGYGTGKTSYARFLAAALARTCLDEPGSRIPILLSLGDFTTAVSIVNVVFNQLSAYFGVRDFSIGAFKLLNKQRRFVLIFDGFDEMKFAMAQNEFAYFSDELRSFGKDNPKLLILGRSDIFTSDDDRTRLVSPKIESHGHAISADGAPDFENLRIAFFSKEEYLALIRNFLRYDVLGDAADQRIAGIIDTIAKLDLGDILHRPVQSKMLAEIVNEPDIDLAKLSRFTLYDLFIKKILRRETQKSARRGLSSDSRLQFMRQLAWWLWTDKKTRTFTALDLPVELIQRFQPEETLALEALRRELLVGSLVEERHTGHFLAEKTAGVFYFPHSTFTEFLVADYIMSKDFLSIDAKSLPGALYGEVPTFLHEHPSGDAMMFAYNRIKEAGVSMGTASITVLFTQFLIRQHMYELVPSRAEPWDICLKYLLIRTEEGESQARTFLYDCLTSPTQTTELAAIFCLFYEQGAANPLSGSPVARVLVHIFTRLGISSLIGAMDRGSVTAESSSLNHLAQIVSSCIRLEGGDRVTISFGEFTVVAASFIRMACVVDDMIEAVPKIFSAPNNDLLQSTTDHAARALLGELLRKRGRIKVIPSI